MGVVQSVVQVILDGTTITLNNATMFPCTGAAAELQNQMQISVPGIPDHGILGINLGASEMKMTIESVGSDGALKDSYLGFFESPPLDLDMGRNFAFWDVGVKLNNTAVVLNELVVPVFFMDKTVDLILKSSDVKLSLLSGHFPITFENLKLEKRLRCKKIGTVDEREIPAKYCSPVAAIEGGRRLARDSGKGFSMTCTPVTAGNTEITV